ncbi:MAG: hypothetical protein ABIO06_04545 [Pseudolysinimonas sp.]
MVYAFTQDVPIDEAVYRKIMASLGDEPLAGLIVHLCVRRDDGGLRYIDVWESEEACTRAFDERIHDAVDKAFGGARPGTEPTSHVLEVLDITGIPVAGMA